MPNPVIHFEVMGADGGALGRFFADLFDWKVNPVPEAPGYSLIDTGVEGAIGGGVGTPQEGPGFVTFYVQVDDLQAYLDKAERLGAKTVMPVTDLGVVTLAMFTDPEGHLIGMVKG